MNIKNLTIALIIALAYEIMLKLSHVFSPSIHEYFLVGKISAILFYFVSATILLFIFFFYEEEKNREKRFKILFLLLIICIILGAFLRLLVWGNVLSKNAIMMISQVMGLIRSALLLIIAVYYLKLVPSTEKKLKSAVVYILLAFGMGIAKNLLTLSELFKYASSGEIVNHSQTFFNFVFIIFIITHLAIINFLYRYYKFQCKHSKGI